MSADVPPTSMVMTFLVWLDFAGPTPADNAACGSGKQQAYRTQRGILDRRDAAIRLHDPHLGRDAVLAKATFKPPQIERDGRADIGVHCRRGEPLIFPDDVHDLMRTANERVRNHTLHDVARLRLVLAVEKREQKADHDGLEAALLEKFRRGFDLIERERHLDLPGRRAQSFVHDQSIAAFDQRFRLPGHVKLQREIMRPLVTRHMEDVTKSAGGYHADVGALALDHHVGRHGGAVQH